ncbi:MAG: hypothetical protein HY851_04160 [candidate division Zixibacteria bacterium]|nr:hypothetical protein [candidate division Zixibacteria bacterium]
MRKRILVAESADAVRQVVESVLRQNGYDVIAVSSSVKASEVLQFSRPDLIVAGGDLADAGRQPFYSAVQNNPQTSSIPLLVIEPADKSKTGLPPEVVITRPIDPVDFAQRVGVFLGTTNGPSVRKGQNQPAPADNRFLDAALGLDNIEVIQSEDMDKTGSLKLPRSKPTTPTVTPYDRRDDDESLSESRRIEFLHIQDDATDIRAQKTKPPAKKGETTGSNLEIMKDQYGISDPASPQAKSESKAHDYDWFVNSVREDVSGSGSAKSGAVGHTAPPSSTKAGAASKPGTNARPSNTAAVASTGAPKSGAVGVEKFIDEFKKEIEILRAHEPEPGPANVASGTAPAPKGLSWEEQVEAMSADHVRLFTKDFTSQLAARLAERIASKIDPDKLLMLLKEEVLAAVRKQAATKP